jgi:protein SCO1/2
VTIGRSILALASAANRRAVLGALAGLALSTGAAFGQGQSQPLPSTGTAAEALPPQAQGVDVEEQIGNTLPPDIGFTNSAGKIVHLGEYFSDGKPAIVALVYYKCPIVCTVVMSRLAETINDLDFTVGKDYRALVFSVDPTEDTALARQTKLSYISSYNREVTPEVDAGWEFHCTDDEAARRLGDALGFKFRKLDTGAYTHPIALAVITPDGKVSRYLYGFVYPARDVKLALMEASEGKLVKTIGDRLLLRCYMYDPKAGSYTLQATRVMQIAGVVTVAALGTLIGGLFIGERLRRNRAHRLSSSHANTPGPTTTQSLQGGPQ